VIQSDDFAGFLRRIRAGDERAAEEMVRQYEPVIRRVVRLRLQDPALNRLLDSMDICQSVLGSFFVRTAAGQFDLEEPGQLVRLLIIMARNKLAMAARRQRAQRRDNRRLEGAPVEALDQAGRDPGPSRVLAGKELLQAVRDRLDPEERQVADRRAQGEEWAAIAAELGGTPDGCRMRLTRALDRIAGELGLEDGLA